MQEVKDLEINFSETEIFRKKSKQTNRSHKKKKKPTQTSRSKRFKNSCKIWQCWWYFRWSSCCRLGQLTAIDITVVSFSLFQWLHFRQDSINLLCHHIFFKFKWSVENVKGHCISVYYDKHFHVQHCQIAAFIHLPLLKPTLIWGAAAH